MNINDLRQKIMKEDHLPILPAVVVKVQQVAQNEKSSALDLAQVILRDQVLTSKLLRIANSAYYGHKVFTVNHAIVMLGFETVRNITLSLVSHSVLNKLIQTKGYQEFWHHSIGTAIAAQKIAQIKKHLILVVPEEAFVAGLVHDVGKMILYHFYDNEYKRVLDLVAKGDSYTKAERKVLDIDHQMAGRLLAEKWRFPTTLTDTIGGHHRVFKDDDTTRVIRKEELKIDLLTSIIHIADLISFQLFGPKTQADLYPIDVVMKRAENLLGIPPHLVSEVMSFTRANHSDVLSSLEIESKKTPDIERRLLDPLDIAVQRKIRQYEHISEITKKMANNDSPREILNYIMNGIHDSLSLSKCVLFLIRGMCEMLEGLAARGQDTENFIDGTRVYMDGRNGVVRRAYKTMKIQNTFETDSKARESTFGDKLTDILGTCNMVAIPIIIRGTIVGLVSLDKLGQDMTYISEDDLQSIEVFINQLNLLIGQHF